MYDSLARLLNERSSGNGYENNTFAYNPAGDLLTLQDADGHATTWYYGVYGRVKDKLDANGNTNFTCQFDPNGRMTSRWTPAKGTTTLGYDAAGNLTGITHPSSPSISFIYDALGRVASMVDGIGTTHLTYDANGFPASEDGPWISDTIGYQTADGLRTNLTLLQPNVGAWTQSYAYDQADRLLSTVSPAGSFGYAEYTGASGTSVPRPRVKKINLPYNLHLDNVYDTMARWTGTSMKNMLLAHQYAYDVASRRTNYTRVAGNSSSYVNYTYKESGQLQTANGYESGYSPPVPRYQEQYFYGYSAVDSAANLNYRTKNGIDGSFFYTNLNQLTGIARGNSMTVAGTVSSLATNVTVNGQPAQLYGDKTFALPGVPLVNGTNTFTAVGRDGYGRTNTDTVTLNLPVTTSYQYDANGNLTSDGVRAFYYDDENQLTNVTVANAWKVEFAYDGLGRRRITRDYGWNGTWNLTNEVRYVYDRRLVIQERDGNNVPKVTYTRGLDLSGSLQGVGGIGGLLARSQAYNAGNWATHLFYHSDSSGNVTSLISTNQGIAASYQYDPFGYLIALDGSQAAGNLVRFSSKEFHANSGLYYFGFRYYDPNLQRWLNQDPLGELSSLHLYRFASNDPVNRIDTNGDKDELVQNSVATFTTSLPAALIPPPPTPKPTVISAPSGYYVSISESKPRNPLTYDALVPPHLLGTPEGEAMAFGNAINYVTVLPVGKAAGRFVARFAKPCPGAMTAGATTAKATLDLGEGEASLVVMKDGQVVAQQPVGSMLTHAEFAAQNGALAADGTLAPGYWIGTAGKVNGQVVAMNSMTFYGNQLPNANVTFALRSLFH